MCLREDGTVRQVEKSAISQYAKMNGLRYVINVNTNVLTFGKTVAAIGLITKRGVNTLILVHTKALLDQWVQRLERYLLNSFLISSSALAGRTGILCLLSSSCIAAHDIFTLLAFFFSFSSCLSTYSRSME